ncbi:hypothetical protein V8F33_003701 [Rhypophila sp. PSN 637]
MSRQGAAVCSVFRDCNAHRGAAQWEEARDFCGISLPPIDAGHGPVIIFWWGSSRADTFGLVVKAPSACPDLSVQPFSPLLASTASLLFYHQLVHTLNATSSNPISLLSVKSLKRTNKIIILPTRAHSLTQNLIGVFGYTAYSKTPTISLSGPGSRSGRLVSSCANAMEPQRKTSGLRRSKRLNNSPHPSGEETESQLTPAASTETAGDLAPSEVTTVLASTKSSAGAPDAPNAPVASEREALFSIPVEMQLKFPQLWRLNTVLQKFYKGKPFPPHIDVAQLIRNFFRSNVFTEGRYEHKAITRATLAMETVYYDYYAPPTWNQWWLPDPAGPVQDDEVDMLADHGRPPYLSPSTILAAVCAHVGDRFPPEQWCDFWQFFEWMLHDPSTWSETMPPFWKGSRFDDPAWIQQYFQPEKVTSSTVPPEICREDVNAWLHGPDKIKTKLKVGLTSPKFPTDWDWYLDTKWEQVFPAPKWVRDALAAREGQVAVASESGAQLESDNGAMEESKSQPEGEKDPMEESELQLQNENDDMKESESQLQNENDAMELDMQAGPLDNTTSIPITPGPEASTQPLDPVPPVLGSTPGVPEVICSAQGSPGPAHGPSGSTAEARILPLHPHHDEEILNPNSWRENYELMVLTLAEVQLRFRDICNGSLEDLREAVDGLRGISDTIKAGKNQTVQNLHDKEAAYYRLREDFLVEQAALRQTIVESEQHLQDSEVLSRQLEAELRKRNHEADHRRKRQKTQSADSMSLVSGFLQDNDLALMEIASNNGMSKDGTTTEDIEILRATYAKHYQTPDQIATWHTYKRAIAKFMPVWNRFITQDWQGGFDVFKARLQDLAVGMRLPKDAALTKMYKVEMQAREEMECWDPIYDRDLPSFLPGDVFGEE